MSDKKKYSLLTRSDIEDGLKKERFRKENVSLIRDNDGKIVRHMPVESAYTNIIPSSIIQINSTYIYQADIGPIIDNIIQTRDVELFQDLSEKYQVVIDGLTYYRDHQSRLDELNLKSLEVSSIFEKRIEVYLDRINTNDLDKTDIERCVAMLDAYLNITFVYLMSAYWIHNKKISNDTISGRKISALEKIIQHIYEQLLANSKLDAKGINIINIDESLYATYLMSEDNGIHKIERFTKHDSRFSSLADFMEFIRRCYSKKIDSQYRTNERRGIAFHLESSGRYLDKKKDFLEKLFCILEKIDAFKNVHSELMAVGEIDFSSFEVNAESEAGKTLQIAGRPLTLHIGQSN